MYRQLAAVQSNPALALGPFLSVDANSENGVVGPHITFKGAIGLSRCLLPPVITSHQN